MKPTYKAISEAFSNGNFKLTYPHLAEDVKWDLKGDKILQSKDQVIEFCEQTSLYFQTVKTIFKTDKVIVDNERIVINGTARFINKENKKTEVSSCDIYVFNEGKLMEIISYCIVTNKEI